MIYQVLLKSDLSGSTKECPIRGRVTAPVLSCVSPSICSGLHDELQVVSTLPPAGGVGEEHLPAVLRHVQVVNEGEPLPGHHLTRMHKRGHVTWRRAGESWTGDLYFTT